jgi:hypothetical protein
VRQHQLVLGGDRSQSTRSDLNIGALNVMRHRLAALEQCVPT